MLLPCKHIWKYMEDILNISYKQKKFPPKTFK